MASRRHGPSSRQHGPNSHRHGPSSLQHGLNSHRHGPSSRQHGLSCQHGPSSRQRGPISRRHGPISRRHGPISRRHGPISHRHGPSVVGRPSRAMPARLWASMRRWRQHSRVWPMWRPKRRTRVAMRMSGASDRHFPMLFMPIAYLFFAILLLGVGRCR